MWHESVLCHEFTRLLLQICHEFERFTEFMPNVKVANFFGGVDIKKNVQELKDKKPVIVVGTPGRIKQVRVRARRTRTRDGPASISPRPHGMRSRVPAILLPGRTSSALVLRLQLAKQNSLNLKTIRFFVLDECDKMLEKLGAWRA